MVHLYNISIDKVGKSKHNNTLLRYRSPKDGPPVFAVQKLLAAQGFQPFSAFRHVPLFFVYHKWTCSVCSLYAPLQAQSYA